jgi:alkylation response protein AidB-like acyl-CoA dehydrogenase
LPDPQPSPRELWRSLGEDGVLAKLSLPGEAQPDPVALAELLTGLDATLPAGLVLSVCVQVATVIPLLRALCVHSQLAAEVLAQALRGSAVTALAATDAGLSGSALLDARTELRQAGDDIVLAGGKEWITNALCCDYALVLARHSAARHFTSFSWILVPADCPGVAKEPAGNELLGGSGLGHLRFDGVRLGREHLVGRRGRALAELALQIRTERLAGALWARAMCRRVLTSTREYLLARPADEGMLWDNMAVRERFGRCVTELIRLDALCRRGVGGAAEAMALKSAYADSAERILSECVALRGADSFRDGGLAMLRAQATMFGIAGGASGAMLAGVADHAAELLEGIR